MFCENIILPTSSPMPLVGLGTWPIDDPKELRDAMQCAFDNGYRFFDTGASFENEHLIGEVLESWLRAGKVKRKDLFITTGLPFSGVHPDRVEKCLNESLQNLKLDFVDMYLIHFPVCIKYDELSAYPVNELGELQTEPTDHVAVWKKMEELVKSGKTKAIGLSSFTQSQITRILETATIRPANLQIEVHIYFQNKELVRFCREKEIPVVAYSPLGNPGLNEHFAKRGWPTRELPNMMSDPVVISIGKKHSKSPAQVMLRFLVQNSIAVIPKSVNPRRIKENIEIFDFELDRSDMTSLENLDRGKRIFDRSGFRGMENHPEFPFK